MHSFFLRINQGVVDALTAKVSAISAMNPRLPLHASTPLWTGCKFLIINHGENEGITISQLEIYF